MADSRGDGALLSRSLQVLTKVPQRRDVVTLQYGFLPIVGFFKRPCTTQGGGASSVDSPPLTSSSRPSVQGLVLPRLRLRLAFSPSAQAGVGTA